MAGGGSDCGLGSGLRDPGHPNRSPGCAGPSPRSTEPVMKRAEALKPLSRDHLKALLAAKRLRDATNARAASRDFLSSGRARGNNISASRRRYCCPAGR